jgi:hydrogenase maturation factor
VKPSDGARCVTCGDIAVPARLVEMRDPHTGRVRAGDEGEMEDVCLDLVEARVGDILLVQAGVAIGICR